MSEPFEAVAAHYGRGGILDAVLAALRSAGHDPERIAPADLAPVDGFHLRGREATVELAERAHLGPGLRVLDIGCGLGGSARYLATEHGCRVTGVDLTDEYVRAARELSRRAGVDDGRASFRTASALALPFDNAGFDVAWTEYAQMNIADKRTFYAEIARVLAPGGRFVCHDVHRGSGGAPHFPVPWSDDGSISFLASPAEVRALLEGFGLRVTEWDDSSAQALTWLERRLEQPTQPLGLHLLTGPDTRRKFENIARNLRENRIVVVQAVAQKA